LREFEAAAPVFSLAFSADGRLLAAQGGNVIHLWENATGKEVRRIALDPGASVWGLALAPDGKTVYSPRIDNSVAAWDVASGKLVRRFCGHSDVVWCLALSGDGRVLASGSEDQTVRLWDAATGKETHRLEHASGVWPLAFGPGGRTLASVGSDGTLQVWDVRTGRERVRFTAEPSTWPLAFAADGKTLATVCWQGTTLHLWDLRGRQRRSVEIASGNGWNVAFAPDGRSLAAGGPDNTLCVWETATGRERLRLSGAGGAIDAVAFAPDGRHVAAASRDNRVRLWDVTGRREPARRTVRELDGLWADLTGPDAARAHRAIWALTAVPDQAVPFLATRFRPSPPPATDAGQVARLIAALDDDEFARREQASAELAKLGPVVETALEQALAAAPSAEQGRRLRTLLEKMGRGEDSPEVVSGRRVVEVLEHIGTPEARQVLRRLTRAGTAPAIRDEACAALGRLRCGK
jgi:hypothetical protein